MGMGLTQHRRGVEAVQMVSNLLLMRGNIGKTGAGICPVRGHSNVQGQRAQSVLRRSRSWRPGCDGKNAMGLLRPARKA